MATAFMREIFVVYEAKLMPYYSKCTTLYSVTPSIWFGFF